MRSKLEIIWGVSALLLATACGGTAKSGPDATGGSGNSAGTANTAGSAGALVGVGGQSGGGSSGESSAGSGGLREQPLAGVGPQAQASKLDVLFVVDNSANMATKQAVLAASVPAFVSRVVKSASDVHFGVITTSIGNHGGTICTPDSSAPDSHPDDQAELLPSKRTGIASYMGSGFLSFDAAGKTGVSDATALGTDFTAMISAAGETGCGYEAPLEAMYRFLVDPEPPLGIAMVQGVSTSTGINTELLAQRAAFLRPDSAVAVVILTDENDCSIRDDGVGWFVSQTMTRLPRATAACQANPNDACCRSCAQNEAAPPSGCQALSADANCANVTLGGTYATWDSAHDSLNLRCFDQMRRFGFDLLNPISRYTTGLTNPKVFDRAGALVGNPFLAARSASLVSVSVIVGAPWQDLAADSSLAAGAHLTYLNGTELVSNARWPLLVGSPDSNTLPTDPLMVESIAPRTGVNPRTSTALAPATSQNPSENPINGHECNLVDNDDLQFACIFPLATPKACMNGTNCDCAADKTGNTADVVQENRPICQPPAGGPAGTTQYFAKGYPGTRELLFARALGERAVPASICAEAVTTTTSPDYGYVPALSALADRIAVTLK